MGDAHLNPNSAQYRGALPANVLDARLKVQVTPSEAWMEAHPGYDGSGTGGPAPKDMEAAFVLSGVWVVPSELNRNRPDQWPGAEVPIACLARIPLLTFRARVDAAFAERGMPALPPLPEETGDEVPS